MYVLSPLQGNFIGKIHYEHLLSKVVSVHIWLSVHSPCIKLGRSVTRITPIIVKICVS